MFFTSLLFLAIIGFIAMDVYLPSLPLISESFGVSKEWAQLTIAIYLLSFSFSQIYFGPLSERIGRKRTVYYGLFIMLLATAFCGVAPDIYALLAGRFFEGVGVGATSSVFRAILRDVYQGDELSQKGSYISVGGAFTACASPVLGAYIQSVFSWRLNFAFIFLFTLFTLGMIHYCLKETHQTLSRGKTGMRGAFRRYLQLIQSPVFMGYSGCTVFTFGGISAYLTFSPFLFQKALGLSAIAYGWLAFFVAIGFGGGGIFNSLFVKVFGRHLLLRRGVYIQILSAILMLLLFYSRGLSVFNVLFPIAIYGFGSSIVFANAFAGAFHFFPSNAGYAGALYGALQVLGGTVLAAFASFLPAHNQLSLGIILLIVGILNLFLQSLGRKFTLKCER